MPQPVEWSPDAATSPIRRLALYGAAGGCCAFLLAIFLGGLTVVALSIRSGDFGIPALVILLALVGGPLSLLYLWPMLSDPEQRPPIPIPDWRPDPVRLAASTVLCAVLTAVVLVLVPSGFLLLLAGWFTLLFLISLTNSTGYLDPDTDTISVHSQRGRLSGVSTVRRFDVPGWTGFLLTYRPPAASAPRFIVVPGQVADAAHGVLRWGVEQAEASETASETPVGRLPFVVAAGCCFVVAAGLGVIGARYAGSPAAIAPGIGLFGVLGLLFGWFAYEQ